MIKKSTVDLFSPLQLSCGVRLKNRIIKSAMSDSLGDGFGNPTKLQINLYEKWAFGGVAASIIGEVQCHPKFAEKPGNLVLNEQSDPQAFKKLAKHGTKNDTLLWPQLGHAGALTYPVIGKPKGPSKLNFIGLSCDELSLSEIQHIPTYFANSAKYAKNLGFSGVQIHAAHGFLLSQFLSPLFNQRSDQYGGTILNRIRLLIETLEEVRLAVGDDFAIAIKINSSDQIDGGLTHEDSLKAIEFLNEKKLDIIDISGGTYFPGAKSSSDSSKEGPYFIQYAGLARQKTSTPLMVTGGFKTKDQATHAVASGVVDLVGLARALILEPSLASIWQKTNENPIFPTFKSLPKGGITAWYSMQLTAIAKNRQLDQNYDLEKAILEYETRDQNRAISWNSKYAS
ncbi:MAG: oxidoreductase [Pseudomonadota bacterium]